MTWSLYFPPEPNGPQRAPRCPQADRVNLNFSTGFTVEFWTQKVDAGDDMTGRWVIAQDHSTELNWGVRYTSASGDALSLLVYETSGGNFHEREWTGLATSGIAWQHCAITFDGTAVTSGTQMQMYQNGVPMGGGTFVSGTLIANTFTPTGDLVLGGLDNISTELHRTSLCDIRLWNTVLSGATISGAQNTRLVGNESNLVGLWLQGRPSERFYTGATMFVDDRTSNTNDFVLQAADDIDQPEERSSFPPAHAMGVKIGRAHV